MTTPAGKTVTYAYDAVGNRKFMLDPDGSRTTHLLLQEERMKAKFKAFHRACLVLFTVLFCCYEHDVQAAPPADSAASIDQATLDRWAAPYRNWHYWPEYVVPVRPNIRGFEKVHMTDAPTVYQLAGDDKWYMSFIGFDGKGYQSFVAESTDLVHWRQKGLAMGFGPEGEFDHGGVTLGAFLFQSYQIKAPRHLKKYRGEYWSLYGAYPRQGGYELRPGYEGVACSEDGFT